MSIWSALGSLWDPQDSYNAQQASQNISQALQTSGALNKSGQLTGDAAIQQGTAQLAATPVGYNSSNLDADSAATGALGATFGDIQKNGGQLTQAVLDQARSDLAGTNVHALDAASRQQAAGVLAQDSQERNWAANNKNQSRAQQLAVQLQKQLWNTAVSHANFQTALNAQQLRNTDRNAAFDLANDVATTRQAAGYNQQNLDRQKNAQDFKNAMMTAQMITSVLGQGASTINAQMNSAPSTSQSAAPGALTASAPTYSDNYAVPAVTAGYSSVNSKAATPKASTMSKYVNPVTGNTVNLNMPTDSSSWGDWITGSSTMAV